MTARSVDKLVESFDNPTIPPIDGEPTYATLNAMNKLLNSNAASIKTNLVCGSLRYLFLTLSLTIYETLSEKRVVPPPNPGATPVITAGTTGPKAVSIRYAHNAATLVSSTPSGRRRGQLRTGRTQAAPRV